jgi:hypothetical protein
LVETGTSVANALLDGGAAGLQACCHLISELPTLARTDLLIPQALDEAASSGPHGPCAPGIGATQAGSRLEQAQLAMQPLYQESLKWVPPRFQKEVKFSMQRLRDRQVQEAKLTSWVLLGSVTAVL